MLYGITRYEMDVIEFLVQGLTNQEIAVQLYIARRTATTHVSNILNKLGLDYRTIIVAWDVGALPRTRLSKVADSRAAVG
ncbi:MAG: LuxR C-terminal-related transcriptional regulator [Thermomicrobiales bacterium]